MSEDNQLSPLPTDRTKRIIQLAQEAYSGSQLAVRHICLSKEAAIKCGQLLCEERDMVIAACGRGKWVSYYDSHFAQSLAQSTAYHWMKLFQHWKNGTDKVSTLSGSAKVKSEAALEANTTRRAMLSLKVFPKKEAVDLVDDHPTPRLDTHLAIINRFVAWRNGLRTPLDKLAEEELAQLRTDFRPIREFIANLEAL